MSKAYYSILEVVEKCGISAAVLKEWENVFSFVAPLKRAGGKRFYSLDDVSVISQLVRVYKSNGESLTILRKFIEKQGEREFLKFCLGEQDNLKKENLEGMYEKKDESSQNVRSFQETSLLKSMILPFEERKPVSSQKRKLSDFELYGQAQDSFSGITKQEGIKEDVGVNNNDQDPFLPLTFEVSEKHKEEAQTLTCESSEIKDVLDLPFLETILKDLMGMRKDLENVLKRSYVQFHQDGGSHIKF